MTVHPATSSLMLPVRPLGVDDGEDAPTFAEPEGAPPLEVTQIEPGEQDWRVSRNMVDLTGALEVVKDLGVVRFDDIDLNVHRNANERYTFTSGDFNSVRGQTLWQMGFSRGDWEARTTTRTVLTCSPTHFHLYAELDAWHGPERVHSATWSRQIPRDHV